MRRRPTCTHAHAHALSRNPRHRHRVQQTSDTAAGSSSSLALPQSPSKPLQPCLLGWDLAVMLCLHSCEARNFKLDFAADSAAVRTAWHSMATLRSMPQHATTCACTHAQHGAACDTACAALTRQTPLNWPAACACRYCSWTYRLVGAKYAHFASWVAGKPRRYAFIDMRVYSHRIGCAGGMRCCLAAWQACLA